ncbi:MAG: hypothetical protein J1F63_00965 [Oscillospiraceae bacterium]|nr:hypothetical protein [Oscillospiraceae bacterium]
MKKFISFLLTSVMLYMAVFTVPKAYAIGGLVNHEYPFSTQCIWDKDKKLLNVYVNKRSCRQYPIEESEYLYTEYVEMDVDYAYYKSATSTYAIYSGYDLNAIMKVFDEYPGRIKRCYGDEILCSGNMTVATRPVFRCRGEVIIGVKGTRPERVDYFPDNYESDGLELTVKSCEENTALIEIDATASDENSKIYAALYGNDDELIAVKSVEGSLEKTEIADGERCRFYGNISLEAEKPVAYVRAFVWDDKICPLAKSADTSVEELDITVSESENGSVVKANDPDVSNVRAYGPLLAYSDRTDDCRYLRTFADDSLIGENSVTIAVKGRYMITAENSRGIELKKIIDV